MSHWAAITVLGQDRPGIVAGVTEVLYRHGCNLEDCSATRLRDSFAMILIAHLPDPPCLEALQSALDRLSARLNIGVDLRDLGQEAPQPPPEGRRYRLAVYGADQPGILYHVAQELAARRCNVVDVATRIAGTPDSPVYIVMLEMTVPDQVTDADLEACRQALQSTLHLDLTLSPIEEETL